MLGQLSVQNQNTFSVYDTTFIRNNEYLKFNNMMHIINNINISSKNKCIDFTMPMW